MKKSRRVSASTGENADSVPFVVWGLCRNCADGNLTPYWKAGDFLRLLSFTLFMCIAVSVGTVVVYPYFLCISVECLDCCCPHWSVGHTDTSLILHCVTTAPPLTSCLYIL